MSWIETYTGRVFDLVKPREQDVDIFDIAHHLSRICRYTGAIDKHYSVAQHCFLVAQWLREQNFGVHEQFQGLLHDAAEAYIGDIHGPLKHLIAEKSDVITKIEDGIDLAISRRFNVPLVSTCSNVHLADMVLLRREKIDILGSTREWESLKNIPLWVREPIKVMSADEAKYTYLQKFDELKNAAKH